MGICYRVLILWSVLFFAFCSEPGANDAHAYISTVSASGAQVLWPGGKVHLNLAGNPGNTCDLSSTDIFNAVVHGLERWSWASGGSVSFDYWQGSDPKIYEPNSSFNGQNSIYFSSNSGNSRSSGSINGLASNVLGLTQVWYQVDSGRILETDIVLNDTSFNFTTHPTDTPGYGSDSIVSSSRPHVYIENVVTHELGHALGLSHSAALQSTMLFMESPEQAHLGCDDEVGVHALYPSNDADARGSIHGRIENEEGAAIFGAHVLAISRRRGVVLATAITDAAGKYAISALEPGIYFLMVEPYFAGAAPLPAYYSGMMSSDCSGKFARTFLSEASGSLEPVDVSAGQSVDAPALGVRCDTVLSGSYRLRAASVRSLSLGSLLYDGTGSGFGAVDQLSGGAAAYSFVSRGGRFEIHALAYSLYSPVKLTLSLQDQAGNPVQVSSQHIPEFEGESGYTNYDASLTIDSLPPGTYTLSINSESLSASAYPAGSLALDSVPYLVITGSVNENEPGLSGSLPVNGRCERSEHFTAYSSPPGNPPRISTSQDGGGVAGFCGSTQSFKNGKKGDKPGEGASMTAVAAWFAPWVLMLVLPILLRLSLGGDENTSPVTRYFFRAHDFCCVRGSSARKHPRRSTQESGRLRPRWRDYGR